MKFLTKDASLSYEEAKIFLSDKNIKTQREYFNWIKGKSIILKLPCNPKKFYQEEWKGWGDYINSKNISNIQKNKSYFYSYEECCEVISRFNVKTKRQYLILIKSEKDLKLPSNPDKTYKRDWISWEVFLKKEKVHKLSYYEAKEYLADKKILNNKDYIKYIKDNNINFLLLYPNSYKEWEGYDIYLNKKYFSYENAKKYLIDKNLKSKSQYINWYNENDINFLPKIPHKYYKDFEGYKKYLSINDEYSKFINYKLAIEYVSKFNVKTQRDYKQWQKINSIDFLPNWPDGVYKEWKGWCVFLNSNGNESTGESIITRFLIDNDIDFVKQKKFSDCKRIYNLSFDFYLPDYNTCIEYNGEQHYKSVKIFGGDSKLKYQKENDKIKKKYCDDNNMKLIIIPYTFIKNIDELLSQFLYKNKIEDASI